VYTLFRHLSTPAILSDATSKSNIITTSKQQSGNTTELPSPVADTIGETIGYLLSFIPDEGFLPCVGRDLTSLLTDLSSILEEGLLDENANEDDSAQYPNRIQVAILEESLSKSDIENQEYILDIPNKDVLLCIFASCLQALRACLEDAKRKRLDVRPEYSITTTPPPGTQSTSIDLLFFEISSRSLGDLFSSMKHILLTDVKSPLQSWCQMACLEVITQLVQDWHKDAVEPAILLQITVLLSECVFFYLQQPVAKFAADTHQVLGDLLQNLLLTPPRVHGTEDPTEFLWTLRSMALETLLDCISLIHKRSENDRNFLDQMVLRTIHCILYTPSDKDGPCPAITAALSFCESRNIAPSLFRLLGDKRCSTFARFIIRALLLAPLPDLGKKNDFILAVMTDVFDDGLSDSQEMDIGQSPLNEKARGKKRPRDSDDTGQHDGSSQLQLKLSPAGSSRILTGRKKFGEEGINLQFLSSTLSSFLQEARTASTGLKSRKRKGLSGSLYLVSSAVQLLVELAHDIQAVEGPCHRAVVHPIILFLEPLLAYLELPTTNDELSSSDLCAVEAMVDAALAIHFRLSTESPETDRLRQLCEKCSLVSLQLGLKFDIPISQKHLSIPNRCCCRGANSVGLSMFHSLGTRAVEDQTSESTTKDTCRCAVEPKMAKNLHVDTRDTVSLRCFRSDCSLAFITEIPLLSR
jgi:hypothetical protein